MTLIRFDHPDIGCPACQSSGGGGETTILLAAKKTGSRAIQWFVKALRGKSRP
jgi:hypothetical protein